MMLKSTFVIMLMIASIIHSQDFSGIRIYINPGHGGKDSDDRHIIATDFWESEGNLGKGLHLKKMLDSLNATTKISRTTNKTSDDLGLSVISADANNFDADFFHSIHSNGFQGTANYTVILYKEVNGSPAFPDAKEMCDIMGTKIYQAHRTTNKYTRGDVSFLGFNLGVLRGLTMPGTLSEGSFHDYIPESWRLKNDSYLKHEAWAITKAFVDYFDLENLPYGEIAGILRDPFEIVDYFYLSGTSDSKKPLNLARVTLLQDNSIYNGDFYNNGFFLIDKLEPGSYDLILEAEDYEPDTVYSVNISANTTTFVDRYLTPKPNYSAPIIEDYHPSEIENVRLDSKIIIDFNVKMNRVAVQQAFSISPHVSGSVSWESNDRRMIFSPNEFLQGGTDYEIKINIFAKSAYDVLIEQPFSHFFTTRSALKLIDAYPDQDDKDISTTVKIKMTFDAPIDDFSLGSNIMFQDMNGEDINLYIDEIDYIGGRIIFEPRDPLDNNTSYQVKLLNGIKDTEGSNLVSDTTIIFTTEPNIIDEGTIINDFEEIGSWWQPAQSGSTSGIDVDNTNFIISSKRAISGNYTGKLSYIFNQDSNSVCRVYNKDEPSLNSNSTRFGMFVFGDLSNNLIEYWFRDNQGNNIPIFIDTLNWTGWKFKEADLSGFTNLKFHSFVIKQEQNGQNKGQLYFDSMMMDIVTDVDQLDSSIPLEFNLKQNYPNPFNPTTVISYSIPSTSSRSSFNVVLKIFDVLGREVEQLVNKVQKTGHYTLTLNASEYPSGVYYYQLKFGDLVQTKKMILLK